MTEQFGPYELRRLLGRGGMGEVYEAYDSVQERTVAVKRLMPHTAEDPEFQRRFRRESRLAARLSSPHVIPIHQYGAIEDQLYIDMRFVDGPNLEQVLEAEGTLDPRAAVGVVEQIASALDAAHHEGLIHRDIKPSNVLLDRTVGAHDFVYLADFGITRAIGGHSQSLTATHALVGSLDYMAPEQFAGTAGPEIDIYSLGCVFFQCLTGTKPYLADTLPALMHAHLTSEPPAPSERHPEVGTAFDGVVREALAKEVADRYPSAGALARAARDALEAMERTVVISPSAGVGTVSIPAPTVAPEGKTEFLVPAGRREHAANGHEPANGDGPVAAPSSVTAGPAAAAAESSSSTATLDRATAVPVEGTSAPAAGSRDGAPPDLRGPAGPTGPIPPLPPSIGQNPRRPGRRTQIGIAAAAVVLVLGVGVAVGNVIATGSNNTATTFQTPGQSGRGPVAIVPPAPVVASVDLPTVRGTLSVGNGPEAVAFSADGKKAYVTGSAGGNVVNVVDTASGAVSAVIPAPGPPQFIALAQDGAHAYVTLYNAQSNQNDVAVLDTAAGAFTAVIPTGQKRPFGLAVSPDGSRVYVPNHDSGDVSVIDTKTNTVLTQIQVPASPHWIAFTPSGRFAYAANHHAGVVTVLDTKTNTVAGVIPIGENTAPHSIAVSPDGRRTNVVNYDGNTMSIIDTSNNAVLTTFPVGINPQSVAFSRDGKHSYVVNNGTNNLSVISTATNQITATVPLGTSPWMVAVAPDGRTAYATNKENNSITVLDLAGGPGTPAQPGAAPVPAGSAPAPMPPMDHMGHSH
ncbi:MAG TPA: serine/threonine-protein kinase [Actinomycetospora sp.]|uniref:serine/threonine-protein kinase n=1 Tax=Actinomycetospora sp. TaxID=1872135 RepID=UPI002F3FDBED